jgi:hypothetical protein
MTGDQLASFRQAVSATMGISDNRGYSAWAESMACAYQYRANTRICCFCCGTSQIGDDDGAVVIDLDNTLWEARSDETVRPELQARVRLSPDLGVVDNGQGGTGNRGRHCCA